MIEGGGEDSFNFFKGLNLVVKKRYLQQVGKFDQRNFSDQGWRVVFVFVDGELLI